MRECGVKGVGGGGVVEWKVCCVRCQVGGKISSEVRDDDEVEVKASEQQALKLNNKYYTIINTK